MTIAKTAKDLLWQNARKVRGRNAKYWRYDAYNKPVHYNKVDIDHIVPQALGGSNDIDNLQLLNKVDNIRKSDKLNNDNRQLFHQALSNKTNAFSNTLYFSKKFEIGMNLLVKQTPVTEPMFATVVAINPKTVDVLLENRTKPTTIVRDRRLFIDPLHIGRRRSQSTGRMNTRSSHQKTCCPTPTTD